jgi:1-acyl-sn-glycerol-3-phosphate acyltransferase
MIRQPTAPTERRSPSLAARVSSNLLRAPAFFLVTGIFGSFSLLASLFEREGRLQHRIARSWARVSLLTAGVRATVTGRENLRPRAIYAANHTSFLDVPLIFAMLPFQFRILAKQSLWKWPFIGWHLHRSGQIPIDEEKADSSVAGLNRALKVLKSGLPLVIFPEGGRTPDGRLQPFMNGPAYLAIRARVPVIPIAVCGAFGVLPMHGKHFVPGPVELRLGEPIETTGYTIREAEQLTARVRAEILELGGQADGQRDAQAVRAEQNR